jgi:methylglutaconyl-CoA hydratase
MEEALALGLLARTAPAAEADAAALELAREIAAHPPEGLRVLKRMFRDFEGTADRVARDALEERVWRRGGKAAYFIRSLTSFQLSAVWSAMVTVS